MKLNKSVPMPENFGNYLLKSEGFEEIELPETISLLPQTMGAKITLLLLALLVAYLLYIAIKRWKKNRYRRVALSQIAKLNLNQENLTINGVLKLAVANANLEKAQGPLYGAAWQHFLNDTANSRHALFTNEMIQYMETQQYSLTTKKTEKAALEEQCRVAAIGWIKKHRIERRA